MGHLEHDEETYERARGAIAALRATFRAGRRRKALRREAVLMPPASDTACCTARKRREVATPVCHSKGKAHLSMGWKCA